MKMHIGNDDTLGMVHSIDTTAANTHDIVPADKLLHGEERRVFADAGYQGIAKREEHDGRDVEWHIAMRPSKRRMLQEGSPEANIEHLKASIRAKVEHPFRYIKRVFGYDKVRYRGLEKNTERLNVLAAFTNLLRGEKYLLT